MIICSNCGAQINGTVNFCPNCGNQIPVQNTVSVTQVSVPAETPPQNISPKSRLAALLLGIFLGRFGVHNFYLGRIGRGIAQVGMFLSGFICYFITVFTLAVRTNKYLVNSSTSELYLILLIPIAIILILAPCIWSLVEWILVACGKMTDKNKLPVLKW